MKLRKRICLKIWCILILSFISANINGEELTIFRGSYLTFGLFGGTQNVALEIRFDTDTNNYYFFYRIAVTETPVWIVLSENDLAIFRNNLEKFIEWEAIARRENASISRELPDSTITPVNIIRGSGYDRAEAGNNINLFFKFDTDTPATRIAGMPLLLIFSDQVVTRNADNNIIRMQVMINLTSAQAQAILAGTEPDNITRTIDRIRRQSDLFN